jgi:iron complex outermembrane receptor protein
MIASLNGLNRGSAVRIRSPRRFVLALAVAAGTAPALLAQTSGDSARADSAQRLKTVTVTAARAAATVGGASAVLVRPAELRSSPAPLLDQALRESPFVHVRLNSRGETELSVRGSDPRQAAVLIDGVPISLGWDHRTDPSLVPITGGERLIIVRGLGSLLTGPNTLGGTIEVRQDPAAVRSSGGRASLGFGVDEFGAYVGSVNGGRAIEASGGMLSIRGGVSHRQRDGLALPSGVNDSTARDGLRTNSDLRETDAFASIRWGTVTGRGIGLTVSGFDAEKGVPPEEHIGGPRLWRYPYHRRTIAAISASTGTVGTPFGYGSLELGVGRNAGRVKIETYDDRSYSTVSAEELGDERTVTMRALLTHSIGPATLRAGITTGDVRYEETLPPAAPANYRQKLRSTGLELETPLGSRTSVAGGAVFDRSETPETGGRTPGQERFDNTGWRFGLTHELNASWGLHASVSERSRFPALRELYSGALNRFRPNPDLKPERLMGIEGGVTMNRSIGPIPRATVQVTGFRHQLDDAVVRITLANPTRFMRVNRDRIESTGAELLAGFEFGTDPDRAVTLSADALLQSIEIFDQTANNAQRHAENNPEARGRMELGLPLPWQMRGFATARHTGTQYCLNADTQSEMTLDGVTTADLAVQRTARVSSGPFRSLRTVLSLDNVSNSAVFDQCGLPQPGRTLRLMMTLR